MGIREASGEVEDEDVDMAFRSSKPAPVFGIGPDAFWTPPKILAVFTTVSFLTYYDRGLFAAGLKSMQATFGLGHLEMGIIGGSYLVGYTATSPVFAHFSNRYPPLRMMALGLFIWCLATTFSGLALEFYSLLLARTFTGIGEASFLCLAPPFIDAFSPPGSRSTWLAMFYSSIPIGYAGGNILGGQWISAAVLGPDWTWRSAFVMEALAMLPLVALCLVIKGPKNMVELKPEDGEVVLVAAVDDMSLEQERDTDVLIRQMTVDDDDEDDLDMASPRESECDRIKHETSLLVHNLLYVLLVLGYASQTFVVGGFAFYGVEYCQEVFGWDEGKAGTAFGGVTLVAGLCGTAFGGWLLDKVRKAVTAGKNGDGSHTPDERQSIPAAVPVIVVLSVVALPAAFFCFYFEVPTGFLALIGVAQFSLFAQISPINSVIMWSIPLEFRPFALAVCVIFIHMLGDAISPSIIGLVLDATGQKWRLSMALGALWLVFPCIFFFAAWRVSVRNLRRGRMYSEESMSSSLLDGGEESLFTDRDRLHEPAPMLDGSNLHSINS